METNTTATMTSTGTGLKTIDKIAEIPVVDSAFNKVNDMYGQIKDRNSLLRTGCNLAEMSLKTLKFASTPITTFMKKPIEQVDSYLSDKVEVLETTYPSIRQPTEQITSAAYTQAKGLYDRTTDIYYKPKETLYTLGDYTVSTATTCGTRVLETCLDNRYAKAVTDPALNYAEKTLDYYMPSTAAMVEGQGAVTRLYNINKRVYTHVYDATFIQLTKLHLQFERMIEKMMSLRKLLEEMYTVHKNQVVSVVSENTLVQRCQTYLRENNWSMERLEQLSKSYYKAILADVNDILEKYMGLIKNFPAYLNGSQIREKIDFLKNQMNVESFRIYFGMTIDYLKQINGQLVAYTNKMMELAVDSKNTLTNICLATLKSRLSQSPQSLLAAPANETNAATNTTPPVSRETCTQMSFNKTQNPIPEENQASTNTTSSTSNNDTSRIDVEVEEGECISEDNSFNLNKNNDTTHNTSSNLSSPRY